MRVGRGGEVLRAVCCDTCMERGREGKRASTRGEAPRKREIEWEIVLARRGNCKGQRCKRLFALLLRLGGLLIWAQHMMEWSGRKRARPGVSEYFLLTKRHWEQLRLTASSWFKNVIDDHNNRLRRAAVHTAVWRVDSFVALRSSCLLPKMWELRGLCITRPTVRISHVVLPM